MKKNKEKQELEITVENFMQDLKHYRRDNVRAMLNGGILQQIEEKDKMDVYRSILALCDRRIAEQLFKITGKFTVGMLELDLENRNQRVFVSFLMTKYLKRIDCKEEADCERLFEIACTVENRNMLQYLIQQGKAVSKYPKLVTCSLELFSLIDKIPDKYLHEDCKVAFWVEAALSDRSIEAMDALAAKGFDPGVKGSDGKSAVDALEKRIGSIRYTNNRTGELKRKKDREAVRYLSRLASGKGRKEKKPSLKKWIISGAAVLVVACIAGGVIFQSTKSDDAAGDSASASYNTDTSLTVADGDTVNIDYTGYVDDVAFDGGSTDGNGADLTIGSGTYIDDFEEQLVGHNVGENVQVTVTFPEDYGVEELNGKEAVFDVTINGIYE
ncbi:FKBP-type peptidyl-prolyl cis-trans isomerase [Dorea acetigenes]|uniref:peptidylprolyl isomerase n=1 Tax=Dorea acetigenes TaxID=2981787 RepID=A0ABT2RKT9_9FIRM|nr:FKBP-type peptidyl-prolyl cis-trans isomerase [Dorea acetigenes]MCU6685966.1 FKBP-type peptidyl-prolyl cis-trans isomerase [Dorea acetigenes]SCI71855.1 Trigger factor [uncultured Clostridium sp.]